MLHPQAAQALAPFAALTPVFDPSFDINARRAEAHAWGLKEDRPVVEHVQDVDAGGVSCRLYRPAVGAPLLVYAHGGGFVFGDLETHDAHARRLALASGWAVLTVDYRRSPEYRYPAATDDIDTVLAWSRDGSAGLGVDASRVAVVGDSAGGHLALVAAHRNPGAFVAAVLVYPCLDPRGGRPSYQRETGGLSAAEMDWYWQHYLGPEPDWKQPELHPAGLDLSGLPPTLVITGECDPLVDEGEEVAAAIASAGVPSVATRYLGMPHAFWRLPTLDAARQASLQIGAFLASMSVDGGPVSDLDRA